MTEEKNVNLSELDWGNELTFPSSRKLSKTPHLIGGRYPCRSVAYVPRMILEQHSGENENLTVLDPFMGSGTTAIEASRFSREIFGVEVDPYARLIATVSSRKYSDRDIRVMEKLLVEIIKVSPKQKIKDELMPSLHNIDYWFNEDNFRELLKLKTSIFEITPKGKFREFFLAAFSDIIRAASKAERQSLKPYISKKYKKIPKPAIDEFKRIAPKYIDAIRSSSEQICPGITWVGDNATSFSFSPNIDIAITSPPYINAMDYTRCIKLESAWVGTGDDEKIKSIKSAQLGEATRRHRELIDSKSFELAEENFHALAQLDRIRFDTLLAYFDDMQKNLECTYRALKPGGAYYIIIGNSRVRGIEIRTHELLAKLAEHVGFTWSGYFRYPIKDHRTSIPRGAQGGKIETEHVIKLQKA